MRRKTWPLVGLEHTVGEAILLRHSPIRIGSADYVVVRIAVNFPSACLQQELGVRMNGSLRATDVNTFAKLCVDHHVRALNSCFAKEIVRRAVLLDDDNYVFKP